MVRTRISLQSERHSLARARAASLGISLAEYVRRLVDRDLAEQAVRIDRSVIFDLARSGGTEVASDKARMIGAATGAIRGRQAEAP